MQLVFFSLTGQTRRFLTKLDMLELAIELKPGQSYQLNQDFVLICPTYESGVDHVDQFMDQHKTFCKGIIGIGNRNFGPDFCHLAKGYAASHQVPLLYTLEFSGTPDDVATVKGILANES